MDPTANSHPFSPRPVRFRSRVKLGKGDDGGDRCNAPADSHVNIFLGILSFGTAHTGDYHIIVDPFCLQLGLPWARYLHVRTTCAQCDLRRTIPSLHQGFRSAGAFRVGRTHFRDALYSSLPWARWMALYCGRTPADGRRGITTVCTSDDRYHSEN